MDYATDHDLLCSQLKHLHNVEARLYCPQTFLTLSFQCGMTFWNNNIHFGIQSSCVSTAGEHGNTHKWWTSMSVPQQKIPLALAIFRPAMHARTCTAYSLQNFGHMVQVPHVPDACWLSTHYYYYHYLYYYCCCYYYYYYYY